MAARLETAPTMFRTLKTKNVTTAIKQTTVPNENNEFPSPVPKRLGVPSAEKSAAGFATMSKEVTVTKTSTENTILPGRTSMCACVVVWFVCRAFALADYIAFRDKLTPPPPPHVTLRDIT